MSFNVQLQLGSLNIPVTFAVVKVLMLSDLHSPVFVLELC